MRGRATTAGRKHLEEEPWAAKVMLGCISVSPWLALEESQVYWAPMDQREQTEEHGPESRRGTLYAHILQALWCIAWGWPKVLFGFFYKILWKKI